MSFLPPLVMSVLTLWHSWSPGVERTADAKAIARSIARAVDDERRRGVETWAEDLRLLAYYAFKESGVQLAPKPIAWDPRAGISCGPWQMRCMYYADASPDAQAREWLRLKRLGGLAGLDSSPRRAKQRSAIALGTILR